MRVRAAAIEPDAQDKSRKFASGDNPHLPAIPLALLAYPVLQAADILLYRCVRALFLLA